MCECKGMNCLFRESAPVVLDVSLRSCDFSFDSKVML